MTTLQRILEEVGVEEPSGEDCQYVGERSARLSLERGRIPGLGRYTHQSNSSIQLGVPPLNIVHSCPVTVSH